MHLILILIHYSIKKNKQIKYSLKDKKRQQTLARGLNVIPLCKAVATCLTNSFRIPSSNTRFGSSFKRKYFYFQ